MGLGADGKKGGEGLSADIVDRIFYVAHDEDIVIEVANRTGCSVILDAGMVFPLFGRVIERYTGEPKEIGRSGKGEFRFNFPLDDVDDASGPPCGTCKIVLRDETGGVLLAKTVCLPTGNGEETRITLDYY